MNDDEALAMREITDLFSAEFNEIRRRLDRLEDRVDLICQEAVAVVSDDHNYSGAE